MKFSARLRKYFRPSSNGWLRKDFESKLGKMATGKSLRNPGVKSESTMGFDSLLFVIV